MAPMHLAVFGVYVALAYHFVAPPHPPPPVTELSKMMSNSASYSVYSRYIELQSHYKLLKPRANRQRQTFMVN